MTPLPDLAVILVISYVTVASISPCVLLGKEAEDRAKLTLG